MRRTKALSDEVYAYAVGRLEEVGRNSSAFFKLQAVIAVKTHNVKEVAEIYGVSRPTIMAWIRNVAASMENRLPVPGKRGRKPLFNDAVRAEIRALVQENPALTGLQLQQIIREKHGIDAHRSVIYRLLKELNFSYITPRPRHYKADAAQQEAFKKNSWRHQP